MTPQYQGLEIEVIKQIEQYQERTAYALVSRESGALVFIKHDEQNRRTSPFAISRMALASYVEALPQSSSDWHVQSMPFRLLCEQCIQTEASLVDVETGSVFTRLQIHAHQFSKVKSLRNSERYLVSLLPMLSKQDGELLRRTCESLGAVKGYHLLVGTLHADGTQSIQRALVIDTTDNDALLSRVHAQLAEAGFGFYFLDRLPPEIEPAFVKSCQPIYDRLRKPVFQTIETASSRTPRKKIDWRPFLVPLFLLALWGTKYLGEVYKQYEEARMREAGSSVLLQMQQQGVRF